MRKKTAKPRNPLKLGTDPRPGNSPIVPVRMDRLTKELLERAAHARGFSLSEYLRSCAAAQAKKDLGLS